jgi:hypothetical protein
VTRPDAFDAGQQFGPGHFPIILHFAREGTIGKFNPAANINHRRPSPPGDAISPISHAPFSYGAINCAR